MESGARGVRAAAEPLGDPKKSSKETAPALGLGAGTAGGVADPSSPNTELSESVSAAGRVGAPALLFEAAGRTAGAAACAGGRAERMALKTWVTERPPVSEAP